MKILAVDVGRDVVYYDIGPRECFLGEVALHVVKERLTYYSGTDEELAKRAVAESNGQVAWSILCDRRDEEYEGVMIGDVVTLD